MRGWESCVAASIALGVLAAGAGAERDISTCGTVFDGVECPLFAADSGGSYIVGGLTRADVGRRVFVTGKVDPFCFSFCQQGDGCIVGATVSECPAACLCEFDGNPSQVDVFDLLTFLDLWFALDQEANVDDIPEVDIHDLLAFLDCWFPATGQGGCP